MEPIPYEMADREVIIRHFVEEHVGHFPNRREALLAWVDETMSKMQERARPGDQLWICRSRYIGPLAGHKGLGIVRDGQIVKYQAIIHY